MGVKIGQYIYEEYRRDDYVYAVEIVDTTTYMVMRVEYNSEEERVNVSYGNVRKEYTYSQDIPANVYMSFRLGAILTEFKNGEVSLSIHDPEKDMEMEML